MWNIFFYLMHWSFQYALSYLCRVCHAGDEYPCSRLDALIGIHIYDTVHAAVVHKLVKYGSTYHI